MGPPQGEVVLDGKKVTGPPKNMAVVFQEYGRSLFPWMRVAENVELPLKNQGVAKDERKRLVEEALEAVGLAHVPQVLPLAALRRHAAARGHRPGRGLPAGGAADGRAVRGGRRADPSGPRGPGPRPCGRSWA